MKLSSLIVLASGALGAPAPEVQNKAPVVIQGKIFIRNFWIPISLKETGLDGRGHGLSQSMTDAV